MISIKRLKIADWRIMISVFKGCKIEGDFAKRKRMTERKTEERKRFVLG